MGADAGFASIIGLAVLVLLYFAQARETASLRDQAELAAQRVAQLESRLAQATANPSSAGIAPSPPPGVQPPGVQPPGLLTAPGEKPAPGFAGAPNPAPPAGVAAPPLSAATKLIPTPPAFGVAGGVAAAGIAGLAERSVDTPGPPGPGQRASGPGHVSLSGASATGAPDRAPISAPVAAGPAGTAPTSAPSGAPGRLPPTNRILTPRPATAAGGAGAGATVTNGTGDHPVIPPPLPIPPRPPVQIRPGSGGGGASSRPRMLSEPSDSGSSPSDLTRVLVALAAIAVVAAIVIVLISVTSGGTSTPASSQTSTPVSNAPTVKTHHHTTPKPAAVSNATVTVSVLNGTAVFHLANDVATQLGAAGFKQGTVTNAASQTQPSTTVEYVPGAQRNAAAVAKQLKLSSSAVQPITADTQALGCPQAGSCNVVVTVGADLAGSSSGTQTQPAG